VLLDLYKGDLLKYSSSNIAKQLTLIEHELMSKVKMCEFRNKILNPEGGATYESITKLSDRFNHISYWVATQIVVAPSNRTRIELLEKFIDIASKLLKYNNFQGVFQIIAGLNNANIQRLRCCWKSVSQKSMRALHVIEEAMSPLGNYSRYRSTIRHLCEKQIPAVPLICLTLQDLTFTNDGNEDIGKYGVVNLQKWETFGACLLSFSKLIETKYTFHRNPLIRRMLWNELLVLPETLIMKHSFAIEARRRTPCAACPV